MPTDNEKVVEALMSTAGLPVSQAEIAQLGELRTGIVAMVAGIREIPGVTSEWPGLVLEPDPARDGTS